MIDSTPISWSAEEGFPRDLVQGQHRPGGLRYFFHLSKEPWVDRSEFVDIGHTVAGGHGEADVIETVGCGSDQLLGDEGRVELFAAEGLAGFEAAHALPERLFEGAAD